MDYQKLDAELIAALEESKDTPGIKLAVFIQTSGELTTAEADTLFRIAGVRLRQGQSVATVTLAPSAVVELSGYSWIRSVRLSQKVSLYVRPKGPGTK